MFSTNFFGHSGASPFDPATDVTTEHVVVTSESATIRQQVTTKRPQIHKTLLHKRPLKIESHNFRTSPVCLTLILAYTSIDVPLSVDSEVHFPPE